MKNSFEIDFDDLIHNLDVSDDVVIECVPSVQQIHEIKDRYTFEQAEEIFVQSLCEEMIKKKEKSISNLILSDFNRVRLEVSSALSRLV